MNVTSIVVRDSSEAHQGMNELYRSQVKPNAARGIAMRIACEPLYSEQRDAKEYRRALRGAYHGMLGELSKLHPVWSPSEGKHVIYAIAAWKNFFRDLFHPEESSEDLDNEEYLVLIFQTAAFAAMDLGITFQEFHE